MKSIASEGDGAGDAKAALGESRRPLSMRTVVATVVVALVVVLAAFAISLVLERPENDVDRSDWAFIFVQLDVARAAGLTGEGIKVGIVDTGMDPHHPSLDGVSVVGWSDFVDGRANPYDDVGHGTAMASIIAGRDPLMGGAPGVELVIAKVVDGDGGSSDLLIADGIDFCLDPDGDGNYTDGVDIISLSLGGRMDKLREDIGSRTQDAVNEAVTNGVLVVASAGNDADVEDVAMPGRIREVICVGAVDTRNQVAPFSSSGNGSIMNPDPNKKPEVVAPGVDITTAYPGERYAKGSGTSQATAFTTAVLALALSAVPELSHDGAHGGTLEAVETIKTALMDTSIPLPGQGMPHDIHSGYGLVKTVDLARALGW